MRKVIKIDKDNKFEINTSWGWAYIYQERFGHDIIPDLVPAIDTILESLTGLLNGDISYDDDMGDKLYGMEITTATNLIWALAKNADEDIPDVKEWLDEHDLPLVDIMPEVMEILIKSSVSTKKAKLLQDRLQELGSAYIQSLSQQQTED